MSFDTLGLNPVLLSAIEKAGFTAPTRVQAEAIPKALAGHDLMVSSQTGSGKTAAFMLPALDKIINSAPSKGPGIQVLVLTPTRELAMQITDATRLYGAHMKQLRTATVVGGVPYGVQIKALSKRVDVLVATPGRLLDHMKAGRVKLSTVQILVLDEADRMLDMGFIEDIETIIGHTPTDRQTLLFSATLDGSIARLARKMLRDPLQIEVSGHKQQHTSITQNLLYADDNRHKMRLLDHILRDADLDQAIVFTATKRGADDLAERLADDGFSAAALHGDMNQRQRTRTLGLLQKHQLRILVATDVAARGIDVQGITHAINYDLPMQPEDYTHRIGRTGRAGHSGQAFTLATQAERHKVRRIEQFIGQPIPAQVIEGLEPKQQEARRSFSNHKGKPGASRFAGNRNAAAPAAGKPGHSRSKPGFGRKTDGSKPEFGFGAARPSNHNGNAKAGAHTSHAAHDNRADSRTDGAKRTNSSRPPVRSSKPAVRRPRFA